MRTLMTCALGGTGLYDLDDRIYINDIQESPVVSVETADRPYYGQYLVGVTAKNTLTVTVRFMIKEQDRAARMAVIQKICGWATRGYLESNIHPNQRLYVVCTQLPEVKTYAWHEEMAVVFTAYGEACWEEITPVSYTVASATNAASTTFKPGGTRPCFLEAEITNNANSALTSVVLTANGESITISGISVAKNQKVILTYDEWHRMVITANGVSVMDKRTGADDLMLNAGVSNSVSCVTNVACKTIFYARGLYR